MSSELKTIKFQMMLSESEARVLDDWGFKNRIKSRAESIRRLCKLALEADERAENLNRRLARLDHEAVRFGEGIKVAKDRRTETASNELLASLAIKYSELFYEYVGDMAFELSPLLYSVEIMRNATSIEEAEEKVLQNRASMQATMDAVAADRAANRSSKEKVRYIDFQAVAKRVEDAIKASPGVEASDELVMSTVKDWLEETKDHNSKIRREMAEHLEQRRQKSKARHENESD